eukprot:7380255-Prymnesium_polylepis.1
MRHVARALPHERTNLEHHVLHRGLAQNGLLNCCVIHRPASKLAGHHAEAVRGAALSALRAAGWRAEHAGRKYVHTAEAGRRASAKG